MKVAIALGFVLGLIFPSVTAASEPTAVPLHDTPRPLSQISFTNERGDMLTLDRWQGKIVLLNVWATWCGPCREEMPTLDRLQETLGGEHFDVVALSIDRAGAGVVRRFFDEIGITHLDIFIDETMKASRDLKILGLPGTLLIGPNRQELGRLIGPAEWDTPAMIALFKAVIAKYTEKEPNQ
ncbi:TlpA disulfide reductase family protein (plasmid) [Thalassobaculum sp. OXR-137]|uniref:TlpA family protein disulfide reductase n=1 Tax=Thalassobaculum sp. OXR-137 TaxID=3100173 RepID=UPI002AC8E520|nr:TlpA disulfide reductase family protein [Thalassobaculum sp. OXR-137]WPZ37157.1 TlpA disulfide reductase family protein [Thalassobaculum sp. OXR-137]